MADSITGEVSGATFGDKRLNKRLVILSEQLGQKPNMSIPAATDKRAETEAAYRFFDNPKVTPQGIVQPHRAATLDRMRQFDVALLVQDTTEVDLTRPEQQVEGAGPLECESKQGAFYHPLMAFNAGGVPLGTVWSKSWVREMIHSGRTPAEKQKYKRNTPIEEKESMRWIEGIRAAREVAIACPKTQCICIADSEADIYELFAEPLETGPQKNLYLLIRACHDRVLTDSDKKLLGTVRSTECLYRCVIDVSSRKAKTNAKTGIRQQTRDARVAEVEIRSATVTLRPPYRNDRTLPERTVNVVLVEETNPPEGHEPICWILLTTLPIDTAEIVKQIVEYYCIRWQIEIYFKTLKSGCRIEERYFERIGRLQNCLAVYTIIAWKILYLCRLARDCPDLNCEVVFEPSQWQPVYLIVKKNTLPATPPTLNEMIRMIASLGGYVIRTKTKPGTQTLWLGLQRLHDLSTAWETFGPNSQPPPERNINDTCVVR